MTASLLNDRMPRVLVADIGGTNTRAALCDGTQLRPGTVSRYRNADFDTLAGVLARFVAEQGTPALDGACIALAGPVSRTGDVTLGRMTNLSWEIDTDALQCVTGAPHVAILNDLQAQAYALPYLSGAQLERLFGPAPRADAAQLVLGVGTGFNAAVAHPAGPDLRVVPASESGHMGLPVGSPQEWALSQYVAGADGFASVEDVLSGRGLERVYGFLRDTHPGAPDRTTSQIVTDAPSDALSAQTLHLFARVLGRIAGDLSLVHLPFGGVYLVGGVARAIAPYMATEGAQLFHEKGRFSTFMEQFGLHVLQDDYAALIGCAGRLIRENGKNEREVTVS